jgi:hypothetical protein
MGSGAGTFPQGLKPLDIALFMYGLKPVPFKLKPVPVKLKPVPVKLNPLLDFQRACA